MAYKVFISHSGTDTWVAKQIESHLKNAGADTFLDAANIEVGDLFEEKIAAELKTSDELVVLFTPWSLKRRYVWMEIGAAVFSLNLRIIVALHGLTEKEILGDRNMPAKIKSTDIILLNDIDNYFGQLQKRVTLSTKR